MPLNVIFNLAFKYTFSMKNIDYNSKTIELIKKYHEGDQSAKDEIIKLNIKMIYQVANRYCNVGQGRTTIDYDDIFQLAAIGMIKAIDTFDIQHGNRFATYAIYCMRNEIFMENRRQNSRNEVAVLNAMIDDEERCEKIDLIEGGVRPEEVLELKEAAEIDNAIQLLPICEQDFFRLYHKEMKTPEEVAKMLDFDANDFDMIEQDLYGSLRRRMGGYGSPSILHLRYIWKHDEYFKDYFDKRFNDFEKELILRHAVNDHLEPLYKIGDERGISHPHMRAKWRNTMYAMETYVIENYIKPPRFLSSHFKENFIKCFPKGIAKQTLIIPSLGPKEKQFFEDKVLRGEPITPRESSALGKVRRELLKKFTIFENNEIIDENNVNILLF